MARPYLCNFHYYLIEATAHISIIQLNHFQISKFQVLTWFYKRNIWQNAFLELDHLKNSCV